MRYITILCDFVFVASLEIIPPLGLKKNTTEKRVEKKNLVCFFHRHETTQPISSETMIVTVDSAETPTF